jgi:hypothetical protein
MDWATRVSLTEVEYFSSILCAQLALGSTYPSLQWVLVSSPVVKCGWSVMLTTHPKEVLRFRKRRAVPSLPKSALHGV